MTEKSGAQPDQRDMLRSGESLNRITQPAIGMKVFLLDLPDVGSRQPVRRGVVTHVSEAQDRISVTWSNGEKSLPMPIVDFREIVES